jgi:hypothetical protein
MCLNPGIRHCGLDALSFPSKLEPRTRLPFPGLHGHGPRLENGLAPTELLPPLHANGKWPGVRDLEGPLHPRRVYPFSSPAFSFVGGGGGPKWTDPCETGARWVRKRIPTRLIYWIVTRPEKDSLSIIETDLRGIEALQIRLTQSGNGS